MKPPASEYGYRWFLTELVSFFLLTLSLWITLFRWKRLPASIPLHYDAAGAPDGWGPKALVLLVPAAALMIYTVLTWIRWRPAPFAAAERSRKSVPERRALLQQTIDWIKLELILLLAVTQWYGLRMAAGRLTEFPIWPFLSAAAALGFTAAVHVVRLRRGRRRMAGNR